MAFLSSFLFMRERSGVRREVGPAEAPSLAALGTTDGSWLEFSLPLVLAAACANLMHWEQPSAPSVPLPLHLLKRKFDSNETRERRWHGRQHMRKREGVIVKNGNREAKSSTVESTPRRSCGPWTYPGSSWILTDGVQPRDGQDKQAEIGAAIIRSNSTLSLISLFFSCYRVLIDTIRGYPCPTGALNGEVMTKRLG